MDDDAHDLEADSFGTFLRTLRLARGLTQEELAERAHLSARGLSDLERGVHSRARPETVTLLANALDLDPTERAHLDRLLHRSPARRRSNGARSPTTSEPGDDLPVARHNLPRQLTSFVGREREIGRVRDLLRRTHLLTLTGAGGCGKTRLALEAAAGLVETFPDGVWQVELAVLTDPTLVPQAVASSLGVPEEPGQFILHVLVNVLKEKRLLLILDNCEHLIDACAELADGLLRASPHLRILATSREPLSIDGETSLRVPPLSVPDSNQRLQSDGVSRFEAVRLFFDRAASAEPTFALNAENAEAVVQICRQLDGLPLALELAAPYLKWLSVEQLSIRLSDRFRLLTRGSRTALPHHQTLRALVDWSYNLLDEPERALLARLAVFAGGFTLAAAETVGGRDEPAVRDVLPALVRLVDTSLVVADAGGERFHLLETLRQYAEERLAGSGLLDAIRCRHAEYYLVLAEDAAARYAGPDQGAWQGPFEAERDNFRAALAWLQERDPSRGLRLASAHQQFWYMHGHVREGQSWLEGLLGRLPEPAVPRATALFDLAELHELQCELAQARGRAEESLAVSREIGDRDAMIAALHLLGVLATGSGDVGRARALLEEGLALARETAATAGLIDVLRDLGLLAMTEHDYGQACALLEESLGLSRATGDRFGVTAALGRLGVIARLEGDYPRARVMLDEGITGARAIGHRPATIGSLASRANLARSEGDDARARALLEESIHEALREMRLPLNLVVCLGSLGVLAIQAGAPARGVRLIAAAIRQDPTLGGMHMPELPIDCEENLPRARAVLGEEFFAQAWAEGHAMTLEQAITDMLAEE